jgi:DNA topoisomerase-1
LIDEKAIADALITFYKGEGVQKGTFWSFHQMGWTVYQCNKKYDFDNLSQADIETLIEDKLQKTLISLLHNWEEEGILVEKARWGRLL